MPPEPPAPALAMDDNEDPNDLPPEAFPWRSEAHHHQRGPGRPRTLSFRQRLEIAICVRETCDRLSVLRPSARTLQLGPILKEIGRLRSEGALSWEIKARSLQLDAIGRFHRAEILKPNEHTPDIERIVAERCRVSPRMVRTIRSDKHLMDLVGLPTWTPREWERPAVEAAQERARRAAEAVRLLALLTPERLAKGDVVVLASGTIMALGHSEEISDDTRTRHRAGCEENCEREPEPQGTLESVDGLRKRYREAGAIVIEYADRREAARAANLRIWKKRIEEQFGWNEPTATELGEDLPQVTFVPAERWRDFWKGETEWAVPEIVVAPWARPSRRRLAFAVTPLSMVHVKPQLTEPPWDFLEGGGAIVRCRLFACTRGDTIVLGPHQMWRYMAVSKKAKGGGYAWVENGRLDILVRINEVAPPPYLPCLSLVVTGPLLSRRFGELLSKNPAKSVCGTMNIEQLEALELFQHTTGLTADALLAAFAKRPPAKPKWPDPICPNRCNRCSPHARLHGGLWL
jgi:hypothetical protein